MSLLLLFNSFRAAAAAVIQNEQIIHAQAFSSPPRPPAPWALPPLQEIIPAYPYLQYQDDPNVVAFFTAYNQLAQGYLDWFNATPLPVYTSPNVTGALLDWIGNGIYGIPRPIFSNLTTSFHGAALNGVPLNTIAINGSRVSSSGSAILATDDFYKRVITWLTYIGDGRVFNAMVLRKRIARFLYGINGTDITLSQAQAVSLSFASPVKYHIVIPASANPASSYFVEAFNSGILSFPFQLSAEIVIA